MKTDKEKDIRIVTVSNETEKISCDGSTENSPHPKVYLTFKQNEKETTCIYCGAIFKKTNK